jgi:rare lipoprotein A
LSTGIRLRRRPDSCQSTASEGGRGISLRRSSSSSNRAPVAALAAVMAAALLLAGCSAETNVRRGKEYFSEKEYGVKASPRVVKPGQPVPKGGGRYVKGTPYKVKGKWFYPDDPKHVEVGMASWYGSAFHGRLTSNGEVYDVAGLTAAHPTMPLPSYARVTNLQNGRSMIVRVNDRGPFLHGRIMDLSQRVAEMLDTRRHGVAKLKVQYMGPAPLDGLDQGMLLASYDPHGGSRTMVASAPTPKPGIVMASYRPPPPPSRPNVGRRVRDDQGSIDDLIYGTEGRPPPRVAPAIVGPDDPIGQLIGPPRSAVRSYTAHGQETPAQAAIDELIRSLN